MLIRQGEKLLQSARCLPAANPSPASCMDPPLIHAEMGPKRATRLANRTSAARKETDGASLLVLRRGELVVPGRRDHLGRPGGRLDDAAEQFLHCRGPQQSHLVERADRGDAG